MMNLVIETINTNRAGDLQNAYNDAMNANSKENFIARLRDNMPDAIIGFGGNHIWVSEKNASRIGLIINPLP